MSWEDLHHSNATPISSTTHHATTTPRRRLVSSVVQSYEVSEVMMSMGQNINLDNISEQVVRHARHVVVAVILRVEEVDVC